MISKWIQRILLLLLAFGIFLSRATFTNAQSCSNSSECQGLIEQYTSKLNDLKTQSNTLSNQIAQFNTQIALTSLKISQTQEQIKLLGGRIDQLEVSLGSLSGAFSGRAVETYKMYRSGEPIFLLFDASNLSDVISSFHYLAKIQEADRNLMLRLQKAQNVYVDQKTQQEILAKELDDQKKQLNAQKAAKAQLLSATKNDETKYQQLLSQAKSQLAAFSKFVATQGGATILNNQTKCDSWGCYYNQRDSLWGNMAIGNSDASMAQYGCLVTSVAMVATHYSKSIKPSDIAGSTYPFFSNTAYMLFSWSGVGINVSRTGITVSESSIDSEINAGRPVIAGLYGSSSDPEHFIVIKGKDGGGYIMNDPFLENGGDRHLTDKYSFSNITRIDKVTIN